MASETLDAQLPTSSLVRRIIEGVLAVGGWGSNRMTSVSAPHIRAAVGAALKQEVEGYFGHTLVFEESRESVVFSVSIRGRKVPVIYRYAWPGWTPDS